MHILRNPVTLSLLLILAGGENLLAQSTAQGRKVALVVGINRYNHANLNIPAPLEFAENDAREMTRELTNEGYAVKTLTGKEATLASIREQLSKLSKQSGDGGIFLVALAGHGIQPES